MIVVAIIGILVAVGMPQYQNYVARAQAADGFSLAGGLKTALAEYHNTNGVFPTAPDDAHTELGIELAENIIGKYVTDVTVSNDGSGTITATFGSGNHAGKFLRLTPTETDGAVYFDCTTDIEEDWRPKDCEEATDDLIEEKKWVNVKLNMNYGNDDRAKKTNQNLTEGVSTELLGVLPSNISFENNYANVGEAYDWALTDLEENTVELSLPIDTLISLHAYRFRELHSESELFSSSKKCPTFSKIVTVSDFSFGLCPRSTKTLNSSSRFVILKFPANIKFLDLQLFCLNVGAQFSIELPPKVPYLR